MNDQDSGDDIGATETAPDIDDSPDMDRRDALRRIGALAGSAPAVTLLLAPSASRAWGKGGSPCEGHHHHHHCGSGHGWPGHGGPRPPRPRPPWGGHGWGHGWGRKGHGWGSWGRDDRGWGHGRKDGWRSGGKPRKPWGREL